MGSAGAALGSLRWRPYLAPAYHQLAVIAQGINHRYRAGATVGQGFDTAGDSVAAFLDAGLAHAVRE